MNFEGPSFKADGTKDEFAEEAKFFTESRLIQRDVEIIIEGVNNNVLIGTVVHPVRNVFFVRETFDLIRDFYRLDRSLKRFLNRDLLAVSTGASGSTRLVQKTFAQPKGFTFIIH